MTQSRDEQLETVKANLLERLAIYFVQQEGKQYVITFGLRTAGCQN